MNCLTDSCSSGVSELMTSARFLSGHIAFHSQYTPLARPALATGSTQEQPIATDITG